MKRKTAPLRRALKKSEGVRGTVEKAAHDLADVNALLKAELADGLPIANVEGVLDQSQAVEVKVQEAATELVTINDALAEEIDERDHLEEALSTSNAALLVSRANEKREHHSAVHDALTTLPNMTLFNDRLRNALAQAHRHHWRLALVFVDLDDFKTLNDARGHAVGDRLLQRVAERLQGMVRAGDTVSRRSGDEFLLLVLEAKDDASVVAFAAKVERCIAEPGDIDGVSVVVHASLGVALYPNDGATPEELLKNADTAMYAAKQKKSGPVLFSQTRSPI